MPEISITVREKTASLSGPVTVVCGNSDYTVRFLFDSEWDAYPTKTARFTYCKNGVFRYEDVLFEGDSVSVPVLRDVDEIAIGVYAGDLHTTTPARVPCARCITDGAPVHDPPAPDVYDQLMEYLAGLQGGGVPAGAATLMISGGVSDIGGDTRAATELLSGEIPLIAAVRYPVNNAVGQMMLCEPRTVRCTAKEIYEIPAGKTAMVSCAVSGMQACGWQMNDRFICTGNSFSTWQDFPLVIDNTNGSESMFVALNFRHSDNSDVSPSDFGVIVATLE